MILKTYCIASKWSLFREPKNGVTIREYVTIRGATIWRLYSIYFYFFRRVAVIQEPWEVAGTNSAPEFFTWPNIHILSISFSF